MVGRLQGKTAIVFGAGSRGAGWGNGKAAAVLFAREGAKIFAVDINPEALEETKKIIQEEGGTVACAVADVTDSESINIAVHECVKCFGGINILHNNVGAPAPGDPVAMSVDTWNKNMAINIDSAFITCKHVLPVMADGGGGAVVNIASIAGIKNLERSLVGYQAGKAAMIQLSRSVAAQWAPKGIRSNCILPGLMATPLVLDRVNKTYNTPKARQAALDERHRMIPMGYMGDAWDTAWAAVYLASEEAKYVTATELIVDGGITAGRPLDWRSGSSSDVIRMPDAGARSYPTAAPRLEKKVALVVGAGSLGPGMGNGKASALLMAREGARVFAVDRNFEAVKETQGLILEEGGTCEIMQVDAMSKDDTEKMVAACLERFERIDILHNNVGGSAGHEATLDMEVETWCDNVLFNVKPSFLATRRVIPIMERQGGGSIIHTASTSGISVPENPMNSYQTGKGGLIRFSRGVALEFAKKGIRSNCVIPGKIRTPMTEVRQGERTDDPEEVKKVFESRARSVPLGCMGEAMDVACGVAYLASDQARYVTATEIVIDGGLTSNCC